MEEDADSNVFVGLAKALNRHCVASKNILSQSQLVKIMYQ